MKEILEYKSKESEEADECLKKMVESDWILRIPTPDQLTLLNTQSREKITCPTDLLREGCIMKRNYLDKRVYFEECTGFIMSKIRMEM